jgi:hypothetical protein
MARIRCAQEEHFHPYQQASDAAILKRWSNSAGVVPAMGPTGRGALAKQHKAAFAAALCAITLSVPSVLLVVVIAAHRIQMRLTTGCRRACKVMLRINIVCHA